VAVDQLLGAADGFFVIVAKNINAIVDAPIVANEA
jgi:hypothetical protein